MFDATWSPGPDAAVSVQWLTPELPALVIYLDPERVAIQASELPSGNRAFSRLLRELAREAGWLATALEAQRAAGSPPEEPMDVRHEPHDTDESGPSGQIGRTDD